MRSPEVVNGRSDDHREVQDERYHLHHRVHLAVKTKSVNNERRYNTNRCSPSQHQVHLMFCLNNEQHSHHYRSSFR